MSGAPTILRKRNANMGGDPVESDRLRPLFLAYIGRRANSTVFEEVGIPVGHGTAWIAGAILRDVYQAKVRAVLDKAGIAVSPCG
jgi:hypothetical protein